jgi:hypothetical protein
LNSIKYKKYPSFFFLSFPYLYSISNMSGKKAIVFLTDGAEEMEFTIAGN